MFANKITYLYLLLITDSAKTFLTVMAFLPGSPEANRFGVANPSVTGLFGRNTLGYGDFSTIFGPQEAAERQMRDLASEYRPPPKKRIEGKQESSKESTVTDGSEDDSVQTKRTLNATKTTTGDTTKSGHKSVDVERKT